MVPYKTVYFDIVGFCNARCPYCHSGIDKVVKGSLIEPHLFKKTLSMLLKERIITKNSLIRLYNWGDPFLHPDINRIVSYINELGLRYAISTNASRVPESNEDFVKKLDHIIFSMPGFSQGSYDRIHGFDFEVIKKNIVQIVNEFKKDKFKGDFIIFYHVYRFNTREVKDCESFADKNGIIIHPYYAILNNWWKLQAFIENKLTADEKKRICEDLFIDDIREKMSDSPVGYNCPQFDYLNIDENSNLVTCCQLPQNHEDYPCGNILTDDLNEIFKKRQNRQVCKKCLGSGLAYYINNALATPDFYRRGLRQKFLVLRNIVKKINDRN